MSPAASVLIAGCGDLGTRLGQRMAAQGWTVYGMRRHPDALPQHNIHPIAGDLTGAKRPAHWPLAVDYVLYCPTPDQSNAAGYRATYLQGLRQLLSWISPKPLRRLLVVSSTRVYGQYQGEWLDECSPTHPTSELGKILLATEECALNSPHPTSCIRLAGLYGPNRRWLIQQVQQGYQVPRDPPQYSNRIHIEDATQLLAHLLLSAHHGNTLDTHYLGVDDEPAPLDCVIRWLAERLGCPEGAPIGQRATGSKRLSNARLRALGWRPHYANYQQGYAAQLAAECRLPVSGDHSC